MIKQDFTAIEQDFAAAVRYIDSAAAKLGHESFTSLLDSDVPDKSKKIGECLDLAEKLQEEAHASERTKFEKKSILSRLRGVYDIILNG